MNKSELVSQIAEKSKLTKKQAEETLEAFVETVKETLAKHEKIQLIGFGTFEVKERAARTGINPRTKEPMDIPASKVPAFKAGSEFKTLVNK